DVHVLDPRVDVPAAAPHFVVARGLDAVVFARAPRHAHEADLEVGRSLDLPDLMAFLGLDHARRPVREALWHAPLERVRGLHQVIVDGNEGVLDRPAAVTRAAGAG